MYPFLLFSFSFFICNFWWGNLPKSIPTEIITGTENKDFHNIVIKIRQLTLLVTQRKISKAQKYQTF